MKSLKTVVLASVLGGSVLGCGGGTEANLPNLVGTWNASAIMVTNRANAGQTANLYQLGVRLTVTFNADLTYTASFTMPGSPPSLSHGIYAQTTINVTLTAQGSSSDVNAFIYGLTNGTLTLSGGSLEYDFGNGTEVPVTMDVTLTH